MKVSQSSRMISMMGERVQARSVVEKKGNEVEGGIIFGAANNKFCPHHTSAERGLPLGWRSFLIIHSGSWVGSWDNEMEIVAENFYESIMPLG